MKVRSSVNLLSCEAAKEVSTTFTNTQVNKLLINNGLDVELNKKRRDTKLITRCFEDILFSLSSERKSQRSEYTIC